MEGRNQSDNTLSPSSKFTVHRLALCQVHVLCRGKDGLLEPSDDSFQEAVVSVEEEEFFHCEVRVRFT